MSAIDQNQAYVDAWNEHAPMGTLVEAKIGRQVTTTRTRTKASLICEIPIIWVHGHEKPIKLMDVKRVKEDG